MLESLYVTFVYVVAAVLNTLFVSLITAIHWPACDYAGKVGMISAIVLYAVIYFLNMPDFD